MLFLKPHSGTEGFQITFLICIISSYSNNRLEFVQPIKASHLFFLDLDFQLVCKTSLWEQKWLFINEENLYQGQTSLINSCPACPVFDLTSSFMLLQQKDWDDTGVQRGLWWGWRHCCCPSCCPFLVCHRGQINFQSAQLSL